MRNAESRRISFLRTMRRTSGFTLIEIGLVMVLITILMVAAYQSIDLTSSKIDAVSKVLRSNLQFAQDLAMTHGSQYGFTGISTTEYQIFEGAPGTPAKDPLTNDNFNVNISPVTFVGAVPTITFLASGQPSIVSDVVVTLTDGLRTIQVTVARSTGFVTVGP